MLQQPLHHCYLIGTHNIGNCMEQLKDDLNHIHKENKIPLIIDADREETLTIDMARSISQ